MLAQFFYVQFVWVTPVITACSDITVSDAGRPTFGKFFKGQSQPTTLITNTDTAGYTIENRLTVSSSTTASWHPEPRVARDESPIAASVPIHAGKVSAENVLRCSLTEHEKAIYSR
jgi:hypothetical protein